MIQKLVRSVKYVDLFAPHFEFFIDDSTTRYKTLVGGIFTLITIATSLVFASLKLSDWANNQISPISTQYTTSSTGHMVDLQEADFTITNFQHFFPKLGESHKINTSQQLIFIPYVKIMNNASALQIEYMMTDDCKGRDKNDIYHYTFCLSDSEAKSLRFLTNHNDDSKNMFVDIILKKCSDSDLKKGLYKDRQCIQDTKIIADYFHSTIFVLNFNIQNFDFQQDRNANVKQNLPFTLTSDDLYFSALSFQVQHQVIDNGWMIFGSQKKSDVIYGFTNSRYNPPQFYTNKERQNTFGRILLMGDTQVHWLKIQYIEIGDLLGLIWSVTRLFMSIGNLIIKKRALQIICRRFSFRSLYIHHISTQDKVIPKPIGLQEIFRDLELIQHNFSVLKRNTSCEECEEQAKQENQEYNNIFDISLNNSQGFLEYEKDKKESFKDLGEPRKQSDDNTTGLSTDAEKRSTIQAELKMTGRFFSELEDKYVIPANQYIYY